MTLQTRSMLLEIPAVAIAKPVASASMCQPKLPKSPAYRAEIRADVLRREHRARERAPEIAQHPAHDNRVAGRHRERADDGDKADVFQRLAALSERLAEGRVRAAAAPQRPKAISGDDARAAEHDDA